MAVCGGLASAQGLGTAFTYQGELRDGASVANGNYDFEFRLFDAATNGTQVGSTVTLTSVAVSNGIFTTVIDFGDQFTGQRRFLGISSRATGQPAYTLLSPRQELRPAPYALHADFVADSTVVSATIVDGTVNTVDLADGSVSTPKIANLAVTTAKIAADAVTSAKIADGAVGLAQINTAQVQARASGSCPTGQPLLGISNTGALICDRALSRISQSTLGPSGSFLGIDIRGSGRPVLAYANDTFDLSIVNCLDDTCSERTINAFTSTAVTLNPIALALRSNGRPLIAFNSNSGQLGRLDCDNDHCSTGTIGVFGRDTTSVAMVIRADDRGLIAAYNNVTGDLDLHDCQDTACNTIVTRTLVSTDNTGWAPSMVIRSNGRPMIAYQNLTNGDLHVYDCANANCTSGIDRTLDNLGNVGHRSSIAQNSAGEIVISYQNNGTADLKLFHCSLPTCDLSNPADGQAQTLVTDGDVGANSVVLIRSGDLPLVLFWDETNNDLRGYDCTNNRCQFGSEFTIDGTLARDVGRFVNAKMRGSRPVAVYNDFDADSLRVLNCANETCSNP
jgi:hypothetical protein